MYNLSDRSESKSLSKVADIAYCSRIAGLLGETGNWGALKSNGDDFRAGFSTSSREELKPGSALFEDGYDPAGFVIPQL